MWYNRLKSEAFESLEKATVGTLSLLRRMLHCVFFGFVPNLWYYIHKGFAFVLGRNRCRSETPPPA